LKRYGPDRRADNLGHRIGSGMRIARDGAQDGQALRRDLNATLSKQVGRGGSHLGMLDHILE